MSGKGSLKFRPDLFEWFGKACRDEHHDLFADSAKQWVISTECGLPFAPVQGSFGISRLFEQLFSDRFVFALYPTGQQTVVPDYIEVVRWNMLNQFSDELDRA